MGHLSLLLIRTDLIKDGPMNLAIMPDYVEKSVNGFACSLLDPPD